MACHWDNIIIKINNDKNISYSPNKIENHEPLEIEIKYMNTLKCDPEWDIYIISKHTKYLLITKGNRVIYSGEAWQTPP